MGKMPDALRKTIARNIRDCRLRKFPGRGGGKRCAEAFGVSPQQWSPWESGKRTPDEFRLEQIATFFDATVEWFRRDHQSDQTEAELSSSYVDENGFIARHSFTGNVPDRRSCAVPHAVTGEDDINHYLWVIDILTRRLTDNGVKVVVTFEKNSATLTHA